MTHYYLFHYEEREFFLTLNQLLSGLIMQHYLGTECPIYTTPQPW